MFIYVSFVLQKVDKYEDIKQSVCVINSECKNFNLTVWDSPCVCMYPFLKIYVN